MMMRICILAFVVLLATAAHAAHPLSRRGRFFRMAPELGRKTAQNALLF